MNGKTKRSGSGYEQMRRLVFLLLRVCRFLLVLYRDRVATAYCPHSEVTSHNRPCGLSNRSSGSFPMVGYP